LSRTLRKREKLTPGESGGRNKRVEKDLSRGTGADLVYVGKKIDRVRGLRSRRDFRIMRKRALNNKLRLGREVPDRPIIVRGGSPPKQRGGKPYLFTMLSNNVIKRASPLTRPNDPWRTY